MASAAGTTSSCLHSRLPAVLQAPASTAAKALVRGSPTQLAMRQELLSIMGRLDDVRICWICWMFKRFNYHLFCFNTFKHKKRHTTVVFPLGTFRCGSARLQWRLHGGCLRLPEDRAGFGEQLLGHGACWIGERKLEPS